MDDLISRQAAIDGLKKIPDLTVYAYCSFLDMLMNIPSAQPEPLTLRVNNELTKEEYDKLIHDIKDAPIVLLPSVHQDRTALHDLLQDAIDDGIITEVQAVRIMERVNK